MQTKTHGSEHEHESDAGKCAAISGHVTTTVVRDDFDTW